MRSHTSAQPPRGGAARAERRDGAEHEPGARAVGLREPADEGRPDRRRAQEDDRVQRHHAPARGSGGGELQRRVHARGERDARGREPTSRSAPRTWPPARAARGAGSRASRSMPPTAISIAPKDAALRAKHGPSPARAMTPPASAGPTMRPVWMTTLFSETALTTR